MSIFDKIFRKKNNTIDTFNIDDCCNGFISEISSIINNSNYITYESLNKAYTQCPVLLSVITNKTQMDLNGQLQVRNADGIVTNSEAKKILELLRNPNYKQDWFSFRTEQKNIIQIFGGCVVEKKKDLLKPTLINHIPQTLTYRNNKLIKGDKVIGESILIKDTLYSENITSRITALSSQIDTVINAYNVLNNQYANGGVDILISFDPKDSLGIPTFNPDEKEKIENNLSNKKYGLKTGQKKSFFSNMPLKVDKIGTPIKDLNIKESVELANSEICRAYGYRWELINSGAGTTYNNSREAIKSVYQDTIIPESNSDLLTLSKLLLPNNTYLQADFSGVEALQTSKSDVLDQQSKKYEILNRMYTNGDISQNDYKTAINTIMEIIK